MKEYLPGSGAMASQLLADIVSVMLFPFGNVALAAPAQQSRRISTSDRERSSKVCMADHLKRYQRGCPRDHRGYAGGFSLTEAMASLNHEF